MKKFFRSNKNRSLSIRLRVILSFGIVACISVLLLEIVFSYVIRTYYYSGVEQILTDRAQLSSNFVNTYVTTSDIQEKSKFLFENFMKNENEKYLIQVIDTNYNMVMDSYDFAYIQKVRSKDVEAALTGKPQVHIETNEATQEKIMAISMPLKKYNTIDGVVRYSVSMEEVDKAIKLYSTQSWLLGGVILLMFLSVSLILSKTIVTPIQKLKSAANEMASGDFDVRAEKIYNDEIGQLADTLNYLASEITKSDKLKKDFISSISHELRTPLTSIKGWGETLLAGLETGEEELMMGLQIICSESERLGNIVEELLDFSRLESNTMRVYKTEVDPKQILYNVYNQFLPRKGTLNFEYKKTGEDVMIYADRNRLKQVFINLIANAIKFTPENGSVTLIAEGFNDSVVISVEDSGIGISQADLVKVKERFFKSNVNAPGSGMGLSIVDEILKLHDADMEIYSELGKGTTVKVIFPSINEKEDNDA